MSPEVKNPPLFGLVLAGGESRRMGKDKGRVVYPRLSPLEQRQRHSETLKKAGLRAFLSLHSRRQAEYLTNLSSGDVEIIFDDPELTGGSDLAGGPGVGILSAHKLHPEAAWLVLACDFPFADAEAVHFLLNQRRGGGHSTAYENTQAIVEPLFCIWEPETLEYFSAKFKIGDHSPQKILEKANAITLKLPLGKALINVNSKEETLKHIELQIR